MENDSGPITAMWAQLQRESRWPRGSVFASCETEVSELMRQIDLMVHAKKVESEQEKQQLHTRLEVAEQGCIMAKSTFDTRQNEVGQLRCQIEGMEISRKDMASEYERQLNTLRGEVCSMKRDYERLQKKYNKHAKEVQKEKNKSSHETDERSAGIQRLTQQHEEYKLKFREWDQERRASEKQIEALESNNKTLAEKCNFLQNQSSSYQAQLGKRKEMLDSTEQSLRTQIMQLETQLQGARDTVNNQDTQLGRLKTSLDDAISAQRRALEEKERSDQHLQKAQQSLRKFEEENNHIKLELDARVEMLKNTQEEVTSLNKDVSRLSQSLTEKDSSIKLISDAARVEADERAQQMRSEIEQLRNSLKKHKRHEKQLLEETTILQDKLDALSSENSHLNMQLASKASELRKVESNEVNSLKSELATMKDKLHGNSQAHEAHSSGMRDEISQLTTELHQRNIAMATLSEKSARIERQHRDHDEAIERKNAELHVSNAQLEALRLENRHLRRNLPNGKLSNSIETSETQKHLQEIQTAYNQSLQTLENQNERLQSELRTLRDKVSSVESTTDYKIESALQESERTVSRIRLDEDRRHEDTKRAGERQVRDLEDRLNDTVNEYEQKLHEMQTEMSLLEDDLEIQNRSVKRLGLENQAMTNFVDGVDHFVKQPINGDNHLLLRNHSKHSSARQSPHSFISEDFSLDSADLATANFLAEQQQRTQELERKLDIHIEDLERSTDATIKKYLSPR